MTRKRKNSKHSSNSAHNKDQGATVVRTPPYRRRWLLLAVRLFPLFVLVLLELALRLAGYGHPTAFFLKVNDNGRAMLTDNPRFGWRFFPPPIARTPRPLYLAAQKPPDTVRVFVLGESAAMGDPEPAYGFARQLERLLQARHPDQKIEVVNTAITAINSHVVRLIAGDCVPREGDFWLVYAGNNEVIGPFGAGTVFGSRVPSLAAVRFVLALQTTRIGQLLSKIINSENEPKSWEGLQFFLRSQLAWDDPRLKRVDDSFAANLDDIVKWGRRSGAAVILTTVPVNLRNFPPLASLHRPGLTPEQLTDWQKLFSAGTQAQAAGHYADALDDFRKAGKIDDAFAELMFQRAVCEEQLKQTAVVDADFRRARDLDALRFRADSHINKIIRQTAQSNEVPMIDAAAEFSRFADTNLFYDHVHLNFDGNYRMARLFAAEIETRWPGTPTNNLPWLTEAEVAQRLAYTAFDKWRVTAEMRGRMQEPPFKTQSNFRARDDRWAATLAADKAVSSSICISNYQSAVALAPNDWVLRANFTRLLMSVGDDSRAAIECAEVTRLMPHMAEGWANRARLARLAGDTRRAKDFFEEALKQQPDSIMVRSEFGMLEASLGENKDARREFLSVLRFAPGSTDTRVNLGLLLAGEGDAAGAAAQYREALRWQTNSVEARVNLANLLASQGENGEALTLLEQSVALAPENPIVRYNFARVLASENRTAEAVTNFQFALRQQPDLTKSEEGAMRLDLGNALARLGQDDEALDAFARAVQLLPGVADAHLNYGMALARGGRYSAAAAEFRETLRLRPDDGHAQRLLEQALKSARGTD